MYVDPVATRALPCRCTDRPTRLYRHISTFCINYYNCLFKKLVKFEQFQHLRDNHMFVESICSADAGYD